MYLSDELVFQRSREGDFSVYFLICEAMREINTKITLEWAQKQFITLVHTLLYFLHGLINPWIMMKMKIFHTSSPCIIRLVFVLLMMSQLIADDVTMTRQVWRDHLNSDIQLVRYRFYSQRYSQLVMYEKCTSQCFSMRERLSHMYGHG